MVLVTANGCRWAYRDSGKASVFVDLSDDSFGHFNENRDRKMVGR